MKEIMAEITAWSWSYLTQQLLMLVLWICLLRVMYKEVQALIVETPSTPPASREEGLMTDGRFCRQSRGSKMRPSSFSISMTQRTEFAQTEGHLSSCPPSLMN